MLTKRDANFKELGEKSRMSTVGPAKYARFKEIFAAEFKMINLSATATIWQWVARVRTRRPLRSAGIADRPGPPRPKKALAK